MITLPKQSAAWMLALFLAPTFSASTVLALPLAGRKKSPGSVLPERKLTASQSQLIDKAIGREKEVVKTVRERAPLVETYIQNMKPDPILGQVPDSDQHFLGRVEFSKIIGGNSYEINKATSQGSGKRGFFKQSTSFLTNLEGGLHLTFKEGGFIQMLLMDSNDFDRQHYVFGYVRNEFLGTTPTAVFDVTPIGGKPHDGSLLRPHLDRDSRGQRRAVERKLCRLREGHTRVLQFRQLAHQRAAQPLAAHLLLCRRERL